ncbi:hypothetical protein BJV74DRAFT_263290 [Russula compacta]|nr:hypothetical protein BJV74DRAFT_263290 [Russula compacta]
MSGKPRSLRKRLDPQVSTPWLDTFELGHGIDAVNGDPRPSPFEDIERHRVVRDSDPPTVESGSKVVHGQHEVSKKSRFRAQGTINTHSPLTLEASFARGTTRIDSKASFMIEQFVHGYYHFDNLKTGNLRLTHRAKSLLQRSPHRFRDEYGDYFIVGYQRRFTFSALIGCNTSNKQYTKRTEDEAKAVWQGALGAGAGKTKKNTTSDSRFTGEARVLQSGCDFRITDSGPGGDKFAIKDVIKMVNGITKVPPRGRKEVARLRHYRCVCAR